MTDVEGTTIGLKDNECGQMGVMRIAGTAGWTIPAPAESEYAVEPVGVAIIMPSAWTCVTRLSFTYSSRLLR